MRTVALILDPAFGERADRIAQEMPVWIVSSPVNDPFIERARRRLQDNGSITAYFPHVPDDRVETCSQVLYDVDEHHGTFSSLQPYEQMLVFGAVHSDFSTVALDDLGLEFRQSDDDPLVLHKRRSAT